MGLLLDVRIRMGLLLGPERVIGFTVTLRIKFIVGQGARLYSLGGKGECLRLD